MVSKLLDIRNKLKNRKPKFQRQQVNQFSKIKNKKSWRKPKGSGSKMRLKLKGHKKMPCFGYSSPKLVRGLNKEGFQEVLVFNVSDLKKIDSKDKVAVISSKVGKKKRIDILKKIKEDKIKVSNVADIDRAINDFTKTSKTKNVKSSKSETKVVKKTNESESAQKKTSKKATNKEVQK